MCIVQISHGYSLEDIADKKFAACNRDGDDDCLIVRFRPRFIGSRNELEMKISPDGESLSPATCDVHTYERVRAAIDTVIGRAAAGAGIE